MTGTMSVRLCGFEAKNIGDLRPNLGCFAGQTSRGASGGLGRATVFETNKITSRAQPEPLDLRQEFGCETGFLNKAKVSWVPNRNLIIYWLFIETSYAEICVATKRDRLNKNQSPGLVDSRM